MGSVGGQLTRGSAFCRNPGADVVLFDIAWPFNVSVEMKCVQVRIPLRDPALVVRKLNFHYGVI